MRSAISKCAFAAGAAALLSTQAVYAAPLKSAPAVDPLVSLSLLGTSQSRTAVCGTGTTCALPTTMRAAATATSPAVAGTAASAAAVQYPAERRVGGDRLAVLWIFATFLGLVLPIALQGDDDDRPISPA